MITCPCDKCGRTEDDRVWGYTDWMQITVQPRTVSLTEVEWICNVCSAGERLLKIPRIDGDLIGWKNPHELVPLPVIADRFGTMTIGSHISSTVKVCLS